MARSRDYYAVLGVSRDATEDQIKKAYRKLAIRYHPDKCKDDKSAEEKFREVSEAYTVLVDTKKRAMYDGHGQRINIDLSDLFRQGSFSNVFTSTDGNAFFRNTVKTNSRGDRGQDIRITMEITLEDVLRGTKKTIKYKRYEKCADCNGRGTSSGERITCEKCKGTGKTTTSGNFGGFRFDSTSVCDDCHGQGKSIKFDCQTCNGTGRVLKDSIIPVTINRGVQEHTSITMKYYGHQGERNGVAGNLQIKFRLIPHKLFKRYINDVVYDAHISLTTAVFGGTISVQTLHGNDVDIDIPKGSNTGDKKVLVGHGLPDFTSGKPGNQIVNFIIDLPKTLTDEQTKLLNLLKAEGL